MFQTPYPFRYCCRRKISEGELVVLEHKLTFSCRFNQQYIVNVEEYPYEVFVPKYHLKNHSDSPRKYELLTNLGDGYRILATAISIMLWFYEKNPYASFAFVGQNLPDESKENTKRFRIYSRIMANYFSPVDFQHLDIKKKSLYLLLNRHNNQPELLKKIEQNFLKIYKKD